MIKVYLNNKEFEIEENINFSSFINQIHENIFGIAVAVNNNIIPKNKWNETILYNEDKIILIKIACGG